jgi:hypothetical protein
MTISPAKQRAKVADEVWIAIAVLHQQHPERFDFGIEEIMESGTRLVGEGGGGSLRRYRMLIETAPGRRRLFRPGDYYHPEREGAKTTPNREQVPYGYNGLLNWYRDWCSAAVERAHEEDPLLALRGSGKQLWADEHADDYVRRLREGWE